MKTLVENLGQYAAYHRDSRNIVTHFVGIPMIVLAVTTLLSRPYVDVAGLGLSPALLLAVVSSIYYLRLDTRLGAVMSALLAESVYVSALFAAQPTMFWLVSGIGLFVIGWILQFIGHVYEGKKPAFVDDIMGLIIGPLFVVAEAAFLLGMRKELQMQIESMAGAVKRN
jgi:uncharacterized membrane protein YGL010W